MEVDVHLVALLVSRVGRRARVTLAWAAEGRCCGEQSGELSEHEVNFQASEAAVSIGQG